MSDQKDLIITCSLNDGSVERVTKRLQDVGFEIDKVLKFAGSIIGRCDKPVNELRNIEEVAAVEESEEKYPQ